MMCSKLLVSIKPNSGTASSRRGFYSWIESGYLWTLRGSLKFRWLVLLLCLGVIAANVPLYSLVKQDYIPTNVDESEFEVNITAQEGASIAAMDATMREAERRLRDIEGIEHMLATVGSRGWAA